MRIDTNAVWTDAIGSSIPAAPYSATLAKLEKLATQRFRPTMQAIGNARGRWFEQLVLGDLWNMQLKNPLSRWVPIRLGSVSEFYLPDLFDSRTRAFLMELKASLRKGDVELITSNPDLLLVRRTRLAAIAPGLLRQMTATELILEYPNEVRTALAGKLKWTDLFGGICVKVTLRPDRRLQALHEGSVLKALMAHLRTRYWMRAARKFRYYCLTTEMTSPDEAALQTAATHSIVSVESEPERAVDGLFVVDSRAQLRILVNSINTALGFRGK